MEVLDYLKSLDPALLIALGAAVMMAVLLIAVMIRSERSRTELTLRLADMAAAQQTAQGQLDLRLREQERALGDRMGDVTRRVGENLHATTEKTHESLSQLRERLAKIDAAQRNITELSSQVVSLQEILSNKQARGAFGNFQLGTLVSDALPAATYQLEATLSNGKRADCLIRLPNPPGPVVIDAKFPLEGWQKIQTARGDAELKDARREFSVAIKKHVTDIAERYVIEGETADTAFMFLPSEAIYIELHQNFPNMVEDAQRRRISIVSPSTLWPALVAMRSVFRDLHMRKHANVLQAEVRVMLDDVERLDGRVEKLQRHFDMATEDVRQIRISTDKVSKRGERIDEMDFEDSETPIESGPKVALIEGGRRD